MDMDVNKEQDIDWQALAREEQQERHKRLFRCRLPEQRTLEQALLAMTRDDLQNICYNLCIKGVSSLKKADLAGRLQQAIPEFSHRWLPTIVEDQYKSLKKLSEGGLEAIPEEDRRTDYLRGLGMLFCGAQDGRLFWYMPEEICAEFKKLDSAVYGHLVTVNAEIVRLATGLLFYYGVMDYDHLYEKVTAFLEKAERPAFFDFVGVLINASYWQHNIVTTDHGMHYYTVIHPEQIEQEQQQRRNLDFAPVSYEQAYDAGEENYIEPTDAFKSFAQYLMQEQGCDVMKASDIIGEVGIFLQNSTETSEIFRYLGESGVVKDEESVRMVSGQIIRLNNSMRLWGLKGHTPLEVSGAAEEKKAVPFRRKKTPGRNDPCPCGSGKKYKRCCMNKEQQ